MKENTSGLVALKEIGELIRADKMPPLHNKLADLYYLKLYDMMNKFIYGGADEQGHKESKPETKAPQKFSLEDDPRLTHIKKLADKKHWKESTLKSFIKSVFSKETTLEELEPEEISTLISALERKDEKTE